MQLPKGSNEKVFEIYKPLRGYIRKLDLSQSLLGLHSHLQFQQFNQKLPSHIIGYPFGYDKCNKVHDFISFHLMPWEMAHLVKEVIIHSQEHGFKHRSLLNWYFLSESVNRLKAVENEITKIYLESGDVISEIHRIKHRQFKWQHPPDLNTLGRYYFIYKNLKLAKIIYEKIGLELDKIFLIGMGLIGIYIDKIALNYPPTINLKDISLQDLDKFISHFSMDISTLKEILMEEQEFNSKFVYSYTSLSAYPLIRMEYNGKDSLVCPITRYLYERFTGGLYYEIYKHKNFDNPFGEAFQNYAGEVLIQTHNIDEIYSEKSYGDDSRTVDWVLKDRESLLFIECKTKRLTINAKIELDESIALDDQLEYMADFVVQVYKSIDAYSKGKYPDFPYDSDKSIYPLIVTLEDWYIVGSNLSKISEKVKQKLESSKLPGEYISRYPYSICSADTYETLIQIVKQVGIKKIMQEKVKNSETFEWEMLTYLQGYFKEELKKTRPLFSKYMNDFLDQYVTSNNN